MLRRSKCSALVFIDDFVLGDLPNRSVLSGEPCDLEATIRRDVRPPSAAWLLLVLLGPVGIVVLLIGLTVPRMVVEGRIPISDRDLLHIGRALIHARKVISIGVAIAAPGAGLYFMTEFQPVGAILCAAGVAVAMAGCYLEIDGRAKWPKIRLDGSQRWITLVGVHPDFAAACDQQLQRRRVAGV